LGRREEGKEEEVTLGRKEEGGVCQREVVVYTSPLCLAFRTNPKQPTASWLDGSLITSRTSISEAGIVSVSNRSAVAEVCCIEGLCSPGLDFSCVPPKKGHGCPREENLADFGERRKHKVHNFFNFKDLDFQKVRSGCAGYKFLTSKRLTLK
jgi:hypothetical protein